MLVDGYPSYDYSCDDILPVDEMSIAIVILLGVKTQSRKLITQSTKPSYLQEISDFEESIGEAVESLEKLRFDVIKRKQIWGGSTDTSSREDLPNNELSVAIALLSNAKMRAELSIANPWGQSMLDVEQQQTMDKASSAIDRTIEILKNSH